jgi:transposase
MIPLGRTGGRKRETDTREASNATRYIDRTGCQWRQLPKDFPPHTTVYKYFWERTRYGVLDQIDQTLLAGGLRARGRSHSGDHRHAGLCVSRYGRSRSCAWSVLSTPPTLEQT